MTVEERYSEVIPLKDNNNDPWKMDFYRVNLIKKPRRFPSWFF